MKRILYFTLSLAILVGVSSCELRDELKGSKDALLDGDSGVVALDVATDKNSSVVPVATKSSAAKHSFPVDDLNIEKYIVKIVDIATENVVKVSTYKELLDEGGEIKLAVGRYKIEAYNYDGSAIMSSARPYFYGETFFQILAGKKTTVHTTCRLQNVGVVALLSDKFNTIFKDDYSITITNGDKGVCIYNKSNIATSFYLNVPENSDALHLTIKATTNENVNIIESYTIKKPVNADGESKLVKNEIFIITLDPNEDPSVEIESKIVWNIGVDLIMNERGEIIEIPTENITSNPGEDDKGIKIEGLNKTYSISADLSSTVPEVQVKFTVPRGIENLFVTIDTDNVGFAQALADMQLDVEFDIANPGDLPLGGSLDAEEDEDKGIGLIDENDPIKGKTSYVFDITDFMKLLRLFGPGNNVFTITVFDGVDTETGKLSIEIVE